MNQPSLEQDKLAQLEALAELAKAGVKQIDNFNRSSQKIAEKWQNIADRRARYAIANAPLNAPQDYGFVVDYASLIHPTGFGRFGWGGGLRFANPPYGFFFGVDFYED